MRHFIGAVGLLGLLAAAAFAKPMPDLAEFSSFNGFAPSEGAEFWSRWHLVTVRYRNDNGEQRFVYANDLAWNAMKSGQKVYPSGAVFAKIAFATKDDPLFGVSREPEHRWTRIQFMKKSSDKAYESAHGWQYAIFEPREGKAPDGTAAIVASCASCHEVAAPRDYVFSRSAFLEQENEAPPAFGDRFLKKSYGDLPRTAKKAIEKSGSALKFASVRVLRMPLFSGSVDESIPAMMESVAKEKSPFLLMDLAGDQVVTVVPSRADALDFNCATPLRIVVATPQSIRKARACPGERFLLESMKAE